MLLSFSGITGERRCCFRGLRLLLLVVPWVEEVHREAEVAALRSGEHGRLLHVQVKGATALGDNQNQKADDRPSSVHGCWRPPRVVIRQEPERSERKRAGAS